MITPAMFLAWLDAQAADPERTPFVSGSTDCCPLAQYLQDYGLHNAQVMQKEVYWQEPDAAEGDWCRERLPRWAVVFVEAVDRHRTATISAPETGTLLRASILSPKG